MTKNEFKIGDRVREKENPCRFGVITIINFYGIPDCLVVRFDDEDERVCNVTDLEIYPDRKTAFLTELQELLRKYDARIYDGDLYAIHIEIGYHDTKSERVNYLFHCSDNDEINADNIMDFDKD